MNPKEFPSTSPEDDPGFAEAETVSREERERAEAETRKAGGGPSERELAEAKILASGDFGIDFEEEEGEKISDHAEKTKELEVPLEERLFASRPTEVSRIQDVPETPQEKVLLSRETEEQNPLLGSRNEVRFLRLKDDGEAIFKPRNGEELHLREKVPAGTYYKRERAAFLVSQFLGVNVVPPTVIREIEGEIGSCQEFVPDTKTWHEMTDEEKQEVDEELVAIWFFDYIVWNTDRHSGNILFQNGKAVAIDHGLTFGADYPLQYHKEFYDTAIPDQVKEKFVKTLSKPARENLKALLQELIPKQEVDACMRRIDRVRKWAKKDAIPGKRTPLQFQY